MPILIDELLVEAEPPRGPPQPSPDSNAPEPLKVGQADRMLELQMVADRHRRLEVD